MDLEKKIREAIADYNKYRQSYVTANLIELEDNTFKVNFEGNFFESCCMDEYFIDLVHELVPEIDVQFRGFRYLKDKKFTAEYEIRDVKKK